MMVDGMNNMPEESMQKRRIPDGAIMSASRPRDSRPMGELPREMQHLEKESELLFETVERLIDLLRPVMREEDPSVDGKPEEQQCNTSAGRSVRAIRERISNARQVLALMSDRIEV